jgi:DNA-binding transcriptional MerR regulator
MEFVPKKLYYKIGEVCEIVGVEAHVLRFWETEFPALAPPKSKNGQRTYRSGDIELILKIRKLLYEDGYTIAGARKRLGLDLAAAKKRTTEKKSQSSVNAPKPVEPSGHELLPPCNFATVEAGPSVAGQTDSGEDFVEAMSTPAGRTFPDEDFVKISAAAAGLTNSGEDFAKARTAAAGRTNSGENFAKAKTAAQPKPGAGHKPPVLERLKRAQKELENILTLLDRE